MKPSLRIASITLAIMFFASPAARTSPGASWSFETGG